MPGSSGPPHQTGHPVMGEIGPRRIAVFIGRACRFDYLKLHIFMAQVSPFGNVGLLRKESVLRTDKSVIKERLMKSTAVRLGAISPITGCPIWYDGIRKPGMRIRVKPSFTYLATLSHP